MQILTMPTGPIGTNTYLAYDEATMKGFIVDPGGYSKVFTDKVEELGIQLEYIMLTHGHADHIMGVEQFKKDFPNAKILASIKEKAMLESMGLNMSKQFGQPTVVNADVLVNDNDEMNLGSMIIGFYSTPGHTTGGMCIHVKNANVVFSGDTLFNASIGRTDFPGSSFTDIAESIKTKLYVLPDETSVYPGHMGPTTIGFEKVNNPFVHI